MMAQRSSFFRSKLTAAPKGTAGHRRCQSCKKRLKRKKGEAHGNFAQRKACSRDCCNKLIGENNRRTKIVAGRRCLVCGKVLKRKEGEQLGNFASRKTCGKKAGCAALLGMAKRFITKIVAGRCCRICDKVLERKESESPFFFAQRKTCGHKAGCAAKLSNATRTTIKVVAGRRCPSCKQLLKRKKGESLSSFARRKTCGRKKCVSWHQHVIHSGGVVRTVTGRRCPSCRKLLKRRKSEALNAFAGRKTCGGGMLWKPAIRDLGEERSSAFLSGTRLQKSIEAKRRRVTE